MFNYSVDPNTKILERFESQINYKHWLFGHYHENKSWNKFCCLYSDIIEIARDYINKIGGFEKFAEWGLIR